MTREQRLDRILSRCFTRQELRLIAAGIYMPEDMAQYMAAAWRITYTFDPEAHA